MKLVNLSKHVDCAENYVNSCSGGGRRTCDGGRLAMKWLSYRKNQAMLLKINKIHLFIQVLWVDINIYFYALIRS